MLIRSDARAIPLRSESMDCVVTSPPYWSLRDYNKSGQIGLERTPQEYVATIVSVFREVRRVLKISATAWLNLGDCYYSGDRGGYRLDAHRWEKSELQSKRADRGGSGIPLAPNRLPQNGLKDKDLVGIPWRVAFALQEDGWWLRAEIVWEKPNALCESVKDRPSRSHETVFLLSKSRSYWYDADAIREPHTWLAASLDRFGRRRDPGHKYDAGRGWSTDRAERWNARAAGLRGQDTRRAAPGQRERRSLWARDKTTSGQVARHRKPPQPDAAGAFHPKGRNSRDVWRISTQPYRGAHFATFPEELARRCVLAGCPPGGLVLDLFSGSGTVGKVALELGRSAILCDLNYHDLARRRVAEVQRPLPAMT